jgi:hypothetical protein
MLLILQYGQTITHRIQGSLVPHFIQSKRTA